ncbi:MAG: MarR family winged helix-turn-helix transcriptional regulator [Beutenbergiaceae bacterium]
MTRWLDREQQRYWRAYMVGSQMLAAALQDDLERDCGLAMAEYELLVRLSESPDRKLRMSVLADGLVHSRSRMTHTVRRMEQRGLVQREPAAGDGRGVDCVMTDDGFSALEGAAPFHVASVRRHLVDVTTPEELAALGNILGKVRERIEGGAA